MKTEDLKNLGLTDEQISGVQRLNGLDVNAAKATQQTALDTMTAERDNLQTRLTEAEQTIAGFDGVDPAALKQEVADYRSRAEQAEANFQQQLTQRDQRDWLSRQLDQYGVTSDFARRQLIADAMGDNSGLAWKDGKFNGFDDFMKSAKEKDGSLYQTAEEKAAQEKAEKAPKFMGPAGGEPAGGKAEFKPPRIF